QLLKPLRMQEEEARRPRLGSLIPEWFAWLASSPISERSKRELAAATAARYQVSMERLLRFVALEQLEVDGPLSAEPSKEEIADAWAPLSPSIFTPSLLEEFRRARKAEGKSAATINRDL